MKTAEELKQEFVEKNQPPRGHLNMARNFWNANLDELLQEHAIEFELFLMKKDNDIDMNRKSVEYAHTEWILEHGKYPNQNK